MSIDKLTSLIKTRLQGPLDAVQTCGDIVEEVFRLCREDNNVSVDGLETRLFLALEFLAAAQECPEYLVGDPGDEN